MLTGSDTLCVHRSRVYGVCAPLTGLGELHNVTVNRRAHISPYLNRDSIDPNLAVIRFDDSDGKPLATVWNFAIHGVCWGADQLLSNGDIMGGANEAIETLIGGVSLFINADAGDISPGLGMHLNVYDCLCVAVIVHIMR